MPKLGGTALREQILRERPGVKVRLLSGMVEPPDGVEFLSKPFQVEILTQMVRRLLSAG